MAEAGSIDVPEGGEWDTADQLPYHSGMQPVRMLSGASVEGAHDGRGGSCSLQLAEEVEAAEASGPVMWCWLSRRDPH